MRVAVVPMHNKKVHVEGKSFRMDDSQVLYLHSLVFFLVSVSENSTFRLWSLSSHTQSFASPHLLSPAAACVLPLFLFIRARADVLTL